MPKLSEEQRQLIIQSVKLDNTKANLQRICNEYDITRQYIYKLIKKDTKERVEHNITEDNKQFTKRANKIIDMVFDRLEKELMENDKITLSQLSTTLGILYDKSRRENNLSTSNKSININIKVEK